MRASLSIMLFLVLPSLTFGVTIFSEEFSNPDGWWGSDTPPTGWVIIDDGGYQEENDWHQESFGSDDLASIGYFPEEKPMSDVLYRTGMDCSSVEECTLDYWFSLDWYNNPPFTYAGSFCIFGSTDSFNLDWHTIMQVDWPDDILSGVYAQDISSWADLNPNVGIRFQLSLNNSWGLNYAYLDSVQIKGANVAVQPASLGKLKAIYH